MEDRLPASLVYSRDGQVDRRGRTGASMDDDVCT